MEDMKVSKLKLKKGDGPAPSASGADVGDIKVARGAKRGDACEEGLCNEQFLTFVMITRYPEGRESLLCSLPTQHIAKPDNAHRGHARGCARGLA